MNGDPSTIERRVARYALVRCVHRSTRTEVFEARFGPQPVLVALLEPHDDESERRLRAMACVESEHVAPVLDLGTDETGKLFVVTPRWEGDDLETLLIKHAPLVPAAVVRLARQLAAGLEALHAGGIVHGQLTPASVFMVEVEDGRLTARIGLPYGTVVDGAGSPLDDGTDRRSLGDILHHACMGVAPSGDRPDEPYPLLLSDLVSGLRQVGSVAPFRNDDELADALSAIDVDGTDLYEDEIRTAARKEGPTEEEPYESECIPLGTVIGEQYELVRRLGRGGMGDVYEARDPAGRPVAVKLIRSGASRQDDETRRRFLREARTAGQIDSDHVVSVLAAGTDMALGLPFLVMELLNGEDLGRMVRRLGPLAPEVAVRIVVDAALGLAAAHQEGLVHRDIKPSNIFLHEHDGVIRIKLCDFGIVKRAERLADHASTQLTGSGGLLGSPLYMSPEQAQNAKEADARSDVWSMCITLYEALTGTPPWADCSTIGQVLLRLYTQDVPPVRESAPWVDPSLARALHRGLARNPSRRYPTAEGLKAALEPFAQKRPLRWDELRGVDTVTRERNVVRQPIAPRRLVQWLAVAAFAAVIGAGAWLAIGSVGSGNSGARPAVAPEPVASVAFAPPASTPERHPLVDAAAVDSSPPRPAPVNPYRGRPPEPRSAEPSVAAPPPTASTHPGSVPRIERVW